MLGCTETITIVHHNKIDDIYICQTIKNASWFSKTTISTSADGAKPVNTYEVRIFGENSGVQVALGDYCVNGIVNGVEMPSDLKNEVFFRITALGNNKRGGLPHLRISGQ